LEVIHANPDLRFVISVDPDRNYLIKKAECYKENSLVYTTEVLSFIDSNGLYIPKEIISVMSITNEQSKRPTVITAKKYISVKSLNQALPSEAFAISKIPQWARVQDENNGKYYIWGKEKPYLTFDSVEAARQWEYETHNNRYLWIPISAFTLIVFVPLAVLFLYLRRHAIVSKPETESTK